jgi:hypothetical protein
MKESAPSFFDRLYRKLRAVAIYPSYRKYRAGIRPDNPLHGFRTRLVGDASADPTEFFDHYDAFAFWATSKLPKNRGQLKILDLGSSKMMNGMLSAVHDVTALVLADCGDQISRVQYVRHDICNPLPFADASFDVFTSMASLPLVGLARYGDKLDPDCIARVTSELQRVMKPDSNLLISMCLGKNVLNFNNGWFLEMPVIQRLFSAWTLVDHIVDGLSGPTSGLASQSSRFTTQTSVDGMDVGDYRVVFLHFKKGTSDQSSATIVNP